MVLLGEKIKRLRNSQNMTQTELAERLNITKSTVSSYENDSRLPSYDVLIKMAQLFNVTIDSLLMDERKGVYFDIDYMTDEQVAVISQLIDIFRTTNTVSYTHLERASDRHESFHSKTGLLALDKNEC